MKISKNQCRRTMSDPFENKSKTVFGDYLLAKYPALRGGDSRSLVSSIESVKLTYDHRFPQGNAAHR